MAKTKRGTPPLFELLENNHLRRGSTGPQPDLRLVRPDAEHEEAEPVRPPLPRFNEPDAIIEKPNKPTAIQLLGDRLHVSLTPLSAAIGVFVISFLVLAALFFGQKRGEKSAIDRSVAGVIPGAPIEGVETVREQAPASHLIAPLLVGSAPAVPASDAPRKSAGADPAPVPSPSVSPRSEWVRDYTYIVAQEFAAGREADAEKAREFLAARGFPARVVKFDSGALQLITLEGYDHKDAAQKKKADNILKKQRAAGADYWTSGGGYRLEGYFKTLKKDEW